METDYFYSKEKDTQMEEYIEEIASIPTDEERVAYFEKMPKETFLELLSYMKWQNAKARSERLLLEAKNEVLREQREQLLKEREENERKLNEAISLLETFGEKALIFDMGEA